MSIRTRAELDKAWLEKKLNYQKDKNTTKKYSFDCIINYEDVAHLGYNINDMVNPLELKVTNLSVLETQNKLGNAKDEENAYFDVVLMNPFSHDAIENRHNDTKVKVDWGDGTSDTYQAGAANFFPFSDTSYIYQNGFNGNFKFTTSSIDRFKMMNINFNNHGCYVAQKTHDVRRYKTNTRNKVHMMHKYKIGVPFTISITASELVVPILVMKKPICHIFPFRNVANEGYYNLNQRSYEIGINYAGLSSFKELVDKVKNRTFSKDTYGRDLLSIVPKKGDALDKVFNRNARDVLASNTLMILHSFVPIIYGIDGELPPALFGNIADNVETRIYDTNELLDNSYKWYLKKPVIRENVYRYGNVVGSTPHKNALIHTAKNILQGLSDREEFTNENSHMLLVPAVSAINAEIMDDLNGKSYYSDAALSELDATSKKLFDLRETETGAGIPERMRAIYDNMVMANGLEPDFVTLLEPSKSPYTTRGSYIDEACNNLYKCYNLLTQNYQSRFLLDEYLMYGENITTNKIAVNPFMYLPTKEAYAIKTTAHINKYCKDTTNTLNGGIKPEFYPGHCLYSIDNVGINNPLKATNNINYLDENINMDLNDSSGVVWNEMYHIYMAAFMDKIKVTGIPIYTYRMRYMNWISALTDASVIKRVYRSIDIEMLKGSHYESHINTVLNLRDHIMPNLSAYAVKTIGEFLLDMYLKNMLPTEEGVNLVNHIFQEIPITIINPFKNVNFIGENVFRNMRNKGRIDGFFCNMFMGTKHPDPKFNNPWNEFGKLRENLKSIPLKSNIKTMSYIFRREGATYVESPSRYMFDYPRESLTGALPDSVENVEVLLAYSDLKYYKHERGYDTNPDTFEIQRKVPVNIFDNVMNKEETKWIDKKLKKITNGLLFCNIVQHLYNHPYNTSGYCGSISELNVVFGYRHLKEIDGLFNYCNLFNNGYISIQELARRPVDSAYESPSEVTDSNIKVRKLIHRCHTEMDQVAKCYGVGNGKIMPSVWNEPLSSVQKYKFQLTGTSTGFELIKTYESKMHSHIWDDTRELRRSSNELKMWDLVLWNTSISSRLILNCINRISYYGKYFVYHFNANDHDRIPAYFGLSFLFPKLNYLHMTYRYNNTDMQIVLDNSLFFTSVNNIAEGYMRTYSTYHHEDGTISLHNIDGYIQQFYQHVYVEGDNEELYTSGKWFNTNIDNNDIRSDLLTNRLTNTNPVIQIKPDLDYLYIPRITAMLFNRWCSPIGWMYLAGTLNEPENANYKEIFDRDYKLTFSKYKPACDLTNLEGLFKNVGPLACDLYPQFDIHDYDDVINLSGIHNLTINGNRFGFIAEKEDNVFVKADKKYNWKDMFKNDSYFYASATDPLAQNASLDHIHVNTATGINVIN